MRGIIKNEDTTIDERISELPDLLHIENSFTKDDRNVFKSQLEEIYNCRCTMVAVLPGVNDETNNREYYEEWLKKKTPRFDLKNKGLQKYTRKEIEKMAHVAKDVAGKYLKRPSKWKGKIEVDDKQNRNAKLWDCSIIATSETAPHILLHEQFHAKSISYYDPDTYDLHRNIEEATVQYLTQEVSKIEDIIIIESGYDDMVDSLREINKLIGGYSDLQFAQKLMQIDTPDRLDYLENYVYNYLKDVDIDTAIRINELMDVIR